MNNVKIPVPCYNCKDRCFCCHVTCAKYAAYKAQLELLKEYNKKQAEEENFNFAMKRALMKKGAARRYYERGKKI